MRRGQRGPEKMSRLYELGLRKEILRENFAGILADFMDYFKRNNIDYKTDHQNPLVILFEETRSSYQSILDSDQMERMDELTGQTKMLNSLLKQI